MMQSAVSCVDVLASFASFSQSQLGATCRPTVVSPGEHLDSSRTCIRLNCHHYYHWQYAQLLSKQSGSPIRSDTFAKGTKQFACCYGTKEHHALLGSSGLPALPLLLSTCRTAAHIRLRDTERRHCFIMQLGCAGSGVHGRAVLDIKGLWHRCAVSRAADDAFTCTDTAGMISQNKSALQAQV